MLKCSLTLELKSSPKPSSQGSNSGLKSSPKPSSQGSNSRLNSAKSPPAQPMMTSLSSSLSRFSRAGAQISPVKAFAPISPTSSSLVKSTSKSCVSSIISIIIASPMPLSAPSVEFFALKNSPSFSSSIFGASPTQTIS